MDRNGRREAAVTHHPLAQISINSARFRRKSGRRVTHQPGLLRASLVGIAVVASPTWPQDALHPRLLAQAPELAALALLDVALAISVRALLAEHPTLEFDEPLPEPLSLRRARRLLAAIYPLQRAAHRYRAAVLAAAAPVKEDDEDLPF